MRDHAGPTHVEAFRRQFEGDAEHFLRLRGMEFGPGGLLLLVLPGMLGGRHICEGLLTCVSDAATELSAQGKIDASLLEDFIWPIYIPTEDVCPLHPATTHSTVTVYSSPLA